MITLGDNFTCRLPPTAPTAPLHSEQKSSLSQWLKTSCDLRPPLTSWTSSAVTFLSTTPLSYPDLLTACPLCLWHVPQTCTGPSSLSSGLCLSASLSGKLCLTTLYQKAIASPSHLPTCHMGWGGDVPLEQWFSSVGPGQQQQQLGTVWET